MFVRAAMLGILAGCAPHQREASRVTVVPVSAANVAPVAGALEQPTKADTRPNDGTATICDIDPAACQKSACAAKTSCGGKAACAGHP